MAFFKSALAYSVSSFVFSTYSAGQESKHVYTVRCAGLLEYVAAFVLFARFEDQTKEISASILDPMVLNKHAKPTSLLPQHGQYVGLN